jgi:hypothetical protein
MELSGFFFLRRCGRQADAVSPRLAQAFAEHCAELGDGFVHRQLGIWVLHVVSLWKRIIGWVAGVGARAVSLARAGAYARCDGYAGAAWATRGPVVLRPQQVRPDLLEGPPCGPSGTFEGSPGLPRGTRVAAISVPSQSLVSRSAEASRSHLQSFDGQRLRHHCWRLAATGCLGPPGPRAFRSALLPGAGRCHVKDGVHFASRRKQRRAHHRHSSDDRG